MFPEGMALERNSGVSEEMFYSKGAGQFGYWFPIVRWNVYGGDEVEALAQQSLLCLREGFRGEINNVL